MSLAESLDILFEDNHCIALNKPCGWPTTHFAGEETVDRLVKTYLKEKYGKPGNVFLGVVHRLDKPVSGALLFAHEQGGGAIVGTIPRRRNRKSLLGSSGWDRSRSRWHPGRLAAKR